MRFTVTWHPSAQDELIHIWLSAPDRQAVAMAVDRVDRALATDPDQKGLPFFGERILVAASLAVTFTVSPDDRLVQVLQVWHH